MTQPRVAQEESGNSQSKAKIKHNAEAKKVHAIEPPAPDRIQDPPGGVGEDQR